MRKWTVAIAVLVAACGGGETQTTAEADLPDPTTGSEQEAPPDTPGQVEEPAEEPADPGGLDLGEIVLTIGDETWEFSSPGCAFSNAPAGDDGSEWNVSSVRDGLQVYINDDSFGTFVSIADIESGGNPTLSWEAGGDDVEITVDGDNISATGSFIDSVGGAGTVEGTLTARCTDWVDTS